MDPMGYMNATQTSWFLRRCRKTQERIRARFPDAAEVVTRLLVFCAFFKCSESWTVGIDSQEVYRGVKLGWFPGVGTLRVRFLESDFTCPKHRWSPSNGRVNEPIFCRVWVLKIARFEGSGYLGWIISSRTFRIGASNRLEVVRAPGNGENMEAWPEVVVETLGRQ